MMVWLQLRRTGHKDQNRYVWDNKILDKTSCSKKKRVHTLGGSFGGSKELFKKILMSIVRLFSRRLRDLTALGVLPY